MIKYHLFGYLDYNSGQLGFSFFEDKSNKNYSSYIPGEATILPFWRKEKAWPSRKWRTGITAVLC